MSDKKPPRTSVTLSPQLDDRLEKMAEDDHTTKREILRKALALYDVVHGAKLKNQRLGIFDGEKNLVTEIVGI
jgi:predicted transcriptional regulator